MTKKGQRKTRHDVRQRYRCTTCGRTFVKEAAEHSSYPARVIMEGISFYNLGHSAPETIRSLTRRFGIAVPEKTFRFWYAAHKAIATYYQIRDTIKKRYPPTELIEKRALQHRQVYLYQLHYGKLEHLLSFSYHRRYAPMEEYLHAVLRADFPHHLFTGGENDRSSNYPTLLSANVIRTENYATKLAALALQIAPSNKKRHEAVERFMLLNDSATIAVEVPIFLLPEDFTVFRSQGFTFPFGEHPITGHIDLMQLRRGYIHILDYKPEARKEKHVITQLSIYALALSRQTGIPVKAFKCAWFDDRDYFEFFPLPAVYPRH